MTRHSSTPRPTFELGGDILDGMPKSGPTDPIEFYRRPLVGWLFRERINLGLRMLGDRRYANALEVGYAAGALQLVLARGVDDLHGIDIDADPDEVVRFLEAREVQSTLVRGSVLDLPYPDGHFELVVCFSVIEHLREYRQALKEMARVLTPTGRLLLGMPSVNRGMELAFRAIGFKGIEDHHVTTPVEVEQAFSAAGLAVEQTAPLDMPRPRPLGVRLYNNWLLRKRA